MVSPLTPPFPLVLPQKKRFGLSLFHISSLASFLSFFVLPHLLYGWLSSARPPVLVIARRVFPVGRACLPHHSNKSSLSGRPPHRHPSPSSSSFPFFPQLFLLSSSSRSLPCREKRISQSAQESSDGARRRSSHAFESAESASPYGSEPSPFSAVPPPVPGEHIPQKEERKTSDGTRPQNEARSSLSFLWASFTDTSPQSSLRDRRGRSWSRRYGTRSLVLPLKSSFFPFSLSSLSSSSVCSSFSSTSSSFCSSSSLSSLFLSWSSSPASSSASICHSCSLSDFFSSAPYFAHCPTTAAKPTLAGTSLSSSSSSRQPCRLPDQQPEEREREEERETEDPEPFASAGRRWRAPEYRRIDPLREAVEKKGKEEEREQANVLSHDVYFDFYGSLRDEAELERQTEKARKKKRILRRHFNSMLDYGRRLYSKAIKTKEGRRIERMLLREEEGEDAKEADKKSRTSLKDEEERDEPYSVPTQSDEKPREGEEEEESRSVCLAREDVPSAGEMARTRNEESPRQDRQASHQPSSSSSSPRSPLSAPLPCASSTPSPTTRTASSIDPERRESSSSAWIAEHEANIAAFMRSHGKREWQEDLQIGGKEVTLISQAWGHPRNRRRREEKRTKFHTTGDVSKSQGQISERKEEDQERNGRRPSEAVRASDRSPALLPSSPPGSSRLPSSFSFSRTRDFSSSPLEMSGMSSSSLPSLVEEHEREEEEGDFYDDEEDEDLPEVIRHLDGKEWIEEVWFEEEDEDARAPSDEASIDSVDAERRSIARGAKGGGEGGGGWRSYRKTVEEVEREVEAALREQGIEGEEDDSFLDAFPGEEEVEEVMRRREERRRKSKRRNSLDDLCAGGEDTAETQHRHLHGGGQTRETRDVLQVDEQEAKAAGSLGDEGEDESVLDEGSRDPSLREERGQQDVWETYHHPAEKEESRGESTRTEGAAEDEKENDEDSRFWNLREEDNCGV